MPLQNFPNIEVYVRSKPVYKGKEALKPSDIQVVVNSRGCPDALIHPAFDPIVEKCTFSTPTEKLYANVLKQSSLPPIDKSVPCRPKAAPPLYDDLRPNPAFEKQLFTAAHPDIHREPYRQLITPSSHFSGNVVQPQAHGKPNVFRDGYGRQEGDRTMMHYNISTKNLGADARLKDSPVRHVVVNPPARQESRPRMHSDASSGSVMYTTSSRRLEPRKRQASNASIAVQPAEYGHVNHTGSHRRPSHRS